jgi:hypothetical protein
MTSTSAKMTIFAGAKPELLPDIKLRLNAYLAACGCSPVASLEGDGKHTVASVGIPDGLTPSQERSYVDHLAGLLTGALLCSGAEAT